MKKTACFIFSMVALSSLAQVKKVAFDQKLTYKIEVENAQEDYLVDYSTIKYDHYIGKNKQESLLSFYYTETSGNSSEANLDRKSTRLNSSHVRISYAVFCLKKKKKNKKKECIK